MTQKEYFLKYEIIEGEDKLLGLKERETGKIILETLYKEIHPEIPYVDGDVVYIKVRLGDQYFLCNMQGIKVTKSYDYIEIFTMGIIPFCENRKWGFLNEKAEVVIPPTYSKIEKFVPGVFKVKSISLWGLVNKDGIIVYPQYENIIYYCDKILVREGNKYKELNI